MYFFKVIWASLILHDEVKPISISTEPVPLRKCNIHTLSRPYANFTLHAYNCSCRTPGALDNWVVTHYSPRFSLSGGYSWVHATRRVYDCSFSVWMGSFISERQECLFLHLNESWSTAYWNSSDPKCSLFAFISEERNECRMRLGPVSS